MKIAQVAPLYESVPPQGYGGTERVVSYLTEELVREGHDVTLFASGDSKTAARLVPCAPRSLRLGKAVDTLAHHVLMLEQVFQRAGECRVKGNLDPFDWSEHPIEKHRKPSIRRTDVAEQHGFT